MSDAAPRARFELGLLIGRSVDRPIALGDLLDGGDGSQLPDVRPGDTTLLFESGGVDRMPLHWVLGDLASLGRQFAAAADRLRAGDIAIVRSAIDDMAEVSSFLFEPTATEVIVSLFMAPPALAFVYPTAPTRGEALYEYVREHRDELLTRDPEAPNRRDILGVAMPLGEMIDALEREAARAEQVVELLGTDAAPGR